MDVLRTTNEIIETGDWSRDNTAGRTLAAAYIAKARATANLIGLCAAIQALATAGRYGGVEVGFAFALAGEIIRPTA